MTRRMAYPAYPAYRGWSDSWLPQVPAHWRTGSLRHFAGFATGFTPPTDDDAGYDGDLPWANISDLGPAWIDGTAKTISESGAVGRNMARPGDLLFSFKLSVGAVSRTQIPLFTNEAIATFSGSMEFDLGYAYYALPVFVPMNANTNIYGAKLLSSSLIKSSPFAAPPHDEQRVIADYLDRETAQIDALIGKQQRLIQTLRERRAALVSGAVVRGVDGANCALDRLIGPVPTGWERKQVKHFFDLLDGRRVPLSSEERSHRRGKFPYYGASGVIDHVDAFLFDEPLVLVSEDGANLVMRSSPIAFVATGQYWVNNHAHVLQPKRMSSIRYWAERIEAAAIAPFVSGAAQPKLTASALMNLRIAVPSSDEEVDRIAAYLDEQTAKIDGLIAKAERLIELAQERRSALITAAVTGQIDVRGIVPLSAAVDALEEASV